MALPTAGTRHFVYDSAGRVMGEYGASAADVQAEFIWMLPVGASGTFGGGDDGPMGGGAGYMPLAVATPDSSSAIQLNWIHADHLGTPVIATDSLGNLTDDTYTDFTYDPSNMLVTASGGNNATLRYDPLGRLFEVVEGANTTRFLYDGADLIGEYNAAGTL